MSRSTRRSYGKRRSASIEGTAERYRGATILSIVAVTATALGVRFHGIAGTRNAYLPSPSKACAQSMKVHARGNSAPPSENQKPLRVAWWYTIAIITGSTRVLTYRE